MKKWQKILILSVMMMMLISATSLTAFAAGEDLFEVADNIIRDVYTHIAGNVQGNTTAKGSQSNATSAKTVTQNGKTSVNPTVNQTVKGASKTVQKNAAQQATQNAKKARFGGAQPTKNGVHQNTNPIGKSKPNIPNVGGVKTTPNMLRQTVKSDNAKPTDAAKEVLQDIAETITSPKDGENDG